MKSGGEQGKVRLWRNRLKRFAEWGGTVEAFCRREGVAKATFFKWKRRLPQDKGRTTPSKPTAEAKTGLFQTVQVLASEVAVRVRLPNGCVVEVGHDQGAMEWVLEKILTRQGPGGDAC